MPPELGDRATLPFCHELGRHKRSGHVSTGKLHILFGADLSRGVRNFIDATQNHLLAWIQMSGEYSNVGVRSKCWIEIGILDLDFPSLFIIVH